MIGLNCFDLNAKVQELHERIREQEEKYEGEVKALKKEVQVMKKQVLDNESIFEKRIVDVQDKYLDMIQKEEIISDTIITDLRSQLSVLESEKLKTSEESIRILQTTGKIKSSLHEELSLLLSQKESLSHHLLDLKEKITDLENTQKQSLSNQLKATQKAHKSITSDQNQKITTETHHLSQISNQKTDLLHKLQLKLSNLQDELNQSKFLKSSRVSSLKTSIQEVKLQTKEYEFKINQIKSGNLSKGKISLQVSDKSKLLESLKEANQALWLRYEKLTKQVF
jgi:hypothetical protein